MKNPRLHWTPKRKEVEKQCASCPFAKDNDDKLAALIVELRKKSGDTTPVTIFDVVACRFSIEEDLRYTGDFACHGTAYGPGMELKPESEHRQCPGATKFFIAQGEKMINNSSYQRMEEHGTAKPRTRRARKSPGTAR